MPYPSVIVAPDDHPVLPSEAAERLAQNLGGHYVAAGTAGRLDAHSGHGPWPDGLMRLGWFLKRLGAH
ncbi:MAG: putative alpha/beta hydrolase family esterase [Hyphomicrobiaceae bacterium]